MYIKSLQLKNFKRFSDAEVKFPSDITVLKGKNEAGKSTVREALVAALFFDPSAASVPQYVKDYQSWHTKDLYELVLEFEASGENYVLEKDFQKQRVFLKNAEGDIVSHDYREVSAKLREFGGYSNKNLFGNLSIIFRDNLILEDKDKKKIVERMRDMVAGTASGASISQILTKLKKGFEDITKGMDPSRPVKKENYGKIKMTEENIKQLQSTLADMQKRLVEKQQAQEIFKEFEEKLTSSKKELDIAKREHEANNAYFVAHQEIEKINKEYGALLQDLEAFKKLEEESEGLQKQLKETKPIGDKEIEKMEELMDKIKFSQGRIREVGSKILDLKHHHLNKYYPSQKLTFIVSTVLILAGFGGLFNNVFFGAWVLLAAFAAYMFISGKYSQAVGLKELEAEKRKREDDLKEDEKDLKKMLSDFNLESPEHVRDHNKNISEMNLKLEGMDKQQKTLLRGRDVKQLEEDKKEFEKQLGVQQSKITDEQKSSPPTPQRQRELEKQISDLEREIEKTNTKYVEAKTRVEGSDISQDDITETEEKLASFQESIGRLKRRSELYQIIGETLKEAQARSLKKTREALQEVMSEYVSQITSGKYTRLQLDEDFNLQVFSSDKDEFVDIDVLSTGAIDQLYIVSRFAFIQLLYNPKGVKEDENASKFSSHPLMLLDDPFVNFDEERKDNMRHVLERLAHDFQIILFTASSDYDTWGSVVEI